MAKGGKKLCKYCRTEIPWEAKICPNCKKKQGGKVKWVIIGIVAIAIIGSVAGGNDDNDSKPVNSTTSPKAESANTKQPTETTTEDKGYISVGESFEAKGLKITINDSDLDFTDYEDEYGWHAPDEGKKYVKASFTFENVGKSDSYVSIYDFDCYADGTLCDQTYNFGGDFINANISSGRNVSFEVYFVVPTNSKEVELEYSASFWTSEKVIIKLQ